MITAGRLLLIGVSFLLLFGILSPRVSADEGEGVEEHRYFTYMNEDGSWHEWIGCTVDNETILDNIQLKVGQPVKCKVVIIPFIECDLNFKLIEPSSKLGYNVLKGNTQNVLIEYIIRNKTNTDIPYHYDKIFKTESTIEYVWVLETTNNWTNGKAALNMYWNHAILDDNIIIDQIEGTGGFAYSTIINSQWTGPSYDADSDIDPDNNSNENTNNNNGSNNSPGFELILLIVSIAVIFLINRRKEQI